MSTATASPTKEASARGAYQRALPPGDEEPVMLKRAVIYVRVSTVGQVHTAGDGEGFSIPAQRQACYRKAEALGAEVVEEYLDAGESARKASSRPQLQAMLKRIDEMHDVDFVIVHKIDRLARNRLDDATINVAIQQAGARLVSCSENIDETPSGVLLHGIMASISEFYSVNLSNEVSTKMAQKAKKGGFPSRAPIGYLNVHVKENGEKKATVVIDDERAPHVRWAFEAYGSGKYTLRQLTAALDERGLRSHATKRTPEKALQRASVHRMLTNAAYVGFVDYKGSRYVGNHEPMVTPELWDRVQSLLASRNQSGERRREHPHYLKGTIYCARCNRRLCFNRTKGNGGVYDYFMCLGRKEGNGCELPHVPVAWIEDEVERLYADIALTPEQATKVKQQYEAKMRNLIRHRETEVHEQRERAKRLDAERRKLLRAHLDGAVPLDLLKDEQERIGRELANTERRIAEWSSEWEVVEANLTNALSLLADCQRGYLRSSKDGRRNMNQAIFSAIYVDAEGFPYTRLAGAFDYIVEGAPPNPPSEDGNEQPRPRCRGRGWSNAHLVELRRLELLTPCLPGKCSSQLSYSPTSG